MTDYAWKSVYAVMPEPSPRFAHALERHMAILADEFAAVTTSPRGNLQAHERDCPICIARMEEAQKKARLDALFDRILDR